MFGKLYMARSECFCENFSCTDIQPNKRLRFLREDGYIYGRVDLMDSKYKNGIVENNVANCELKPRVRYQDRIATHDPRSVKIKK